MANSMCLIASLSLLVAVASASVFNYNSNEWLQPTAASPLHNSNVAPSHKAPVFSWFKSCEQQSARDLRAIPDDCARFHMCSSGVLISFTCPHGTVFNEENKSCVAKGSAEDTCTGEELTATKVICPPKATDKKAHPKECAQYYHCGAPAQELRWEQHLKECVYPMLFNVENKRCEHFSMVKCGLRQEPLDPCDYKSNECGTISCAPCHVRHPSCRGKHDGMNGWEGRRGSPHFVVCASQRVVYSGMCPQEGGVQLFDHDLKMCVPMNAKQA